LQHDPRELRVRGTRIIRAKRMISNHQESKIM
jgi:hypothetical protein